MTQHSRDPAPAHRGPPAWVTIILIVITVLAFAPLISVLIGGVLQDAFHCEGFDTGVRNCSGYGAQIEGPISFMLFMGWFMIVTFPLMAVTPLLWIGWLFAVWQAQRRRRAAQSVS